ncbi:MAG: hypothetical protein PHQ28_00845 [Mycobacterium sp.]|nr:hypothetical protein [Mycobacterium sp.]
MTVTAEATLPCAECQELFGNVMRPSSFPPISLEEVAAGEAAVREILTARRAFTGEAG